MALASPLQVTAARPRVAAVRSARRVSAARPVAALGSGCLNLSSRSLTDTARLARVNAGGAVRGRGLRVVAEEGQFAGAEEKAGKEGQFNQLLGIKGGSKETNIWKIRLQLTKPVTWVPLVWHGPGACTRSLFRST